MDAILWRDEWEQWLVLATAKNVAVALVVLGIAYLSLRRWLWHGRRVRWLLAAVVTAGLAVGYVRGAALFDSYSLERIQMARELGISVQEMRSLKFFPVDALASRIERDGMPSEQVHALTRRARHRYVCEGGKAEKYLFFADRWGTEESDPSVLLVVHYTRKGDHLTAERTQIPDSAHTVTDCAEF